MEVAGEQTRLSQIRRHNLGSREWKLQSLTVAVSAAREEIRAAIPDSLLRTGAGLGHHFLAWGLLQLSKWRVLRKATLTQTQFTELRGCNGDAIYVLPEYRDHSPGVQSGHSKTTVSFCLYLCIAALSLKVAMLPGAWSSSVLEVCIKNCAKPRLQISSWLILKWS
jgi:hypothetical protein